MSCVCDCGRDIKPSTCYSSYHCREAPCIEANRLRSMRGAKRRALGYQSVYVDARPLRRRLEAFAANGTSYRRVALAAGVSKTNLCAIVAGRQTRCHVQTVKAIFDLPTNPAVWPRIDPPGLDRIAIDLALDEFHPPVPLTEAEQLEVIRIGLERGIYQEVVWTRAGIPERTYRRLLARLRHAA